MLYQVGRACGKVPNSGGSTAGVSVRLDENVLHVHAQVNVVCDDISCGLENLKVWPCQ